MPDDQAGHRQRLKERFQKSGRDGLHDYELLELLLSFAIPRRDTKGLAKELIRRYGSFAAVFDQHDLAKVPGMGEHSATLLLAVKASMQAYLESESLDNPVLDSPQKTISYLRGELGGLAKEAFMVLCLNSAGEVTARETISRGTINQTAVYPREVIEAAIRHNSAAIILVHNHPSGSLKPSQHDHELTSSLSELGQSLGITVHDHIIVTRESAYSLKLERIIS